MKNLRKLLYPFTLVYGLIVWLRNKFFDWNLLQSKKYDFPVICVGNLSVGGTGKTPMIEYLIRLLKEKHKVATLSRGYKRKTKGYFLLDKQDKAEDTGDEPLQFKTKYPEVHVAVDEDRRNGIAHLRKENPLPEVVLLDDAFQHRKVKPGFSIVLTSYDALYTDDLLLPAGNLRESKSGAKRADSIVVTKCPPQLSSEERKAIKKRINPIAKQTVHFSFIAYADHITNSKKTIQLNSLKQKFCLVTGIANPKPLVDYLATHDLKFNHKRFPDHHNFSKNEIDDLKKEDFILTTEKDYMRLKPYLSTGKLFYFPIKHDFIEDKNEFDGKILRWVYNKLKIK